MVEKYLKNAIDASYAALGIDRHIRGVALEEDYKKIDGIADLTYMISSNMSPINIDLMVKVFWPKKIETIK